jgi:probable addiction module antidote protein
MPKRTREYREALLEDLEDPKEAAAYLNAALEDSDEMFLIALRHVAEARQMAQVAEHAGVSRESLYRMLSRYGNPRFTSFAGVLKALGLKIAIQPQSTRRSGRRGLPQHRLG